MSERCGTCIMPTSLPGVTLDAQKKCNYCRTFEEEIGRIPVNAVRNRHEELRALLNAYRGKGDYDVMVPVSGGKDSMFALYLVAKVFGMKVLAYNFDNGFQSTRARDNIQRAVKKLGVELIVFKPSEERLFKLYRTFLLRSGEFCSPCNMMIGAMAHRFAEQNRIGLIALGGARERDSGIQGISMSSYTDRRYYLNVIKGLIDYEDVRLYVRSSPEVRALRRLFRGEAHEIDILDYIHPGTEELKNTLMREIGWTPTSEELEHGDCVLNPLKDYLMNRKWGYSETTQAYSCLVRIGELRRDEALRIAEHEEVRTEPGIVPEFLAKIGVTRDQFEQSRNRHFTEFPNYTASTSFRIQRKVVRSIRRVISRVRGKASG